MNRLVAIFLVLIVYNPVMSQQLQVQHSNGYAQGTTYSIDYVDNQNRKFDDAFIQLLSDFDQIFSAYKSTSIISRINRNEDTVKVDSLFEHCFNRSMTISKESNGDFDITVAPLVNAWGFGPKQRMEMDSAIVDSLFHCIGYKDVSIVNHQVIKKNPRITLDFDAIAQGYSTDLVSQFLRTKGVNDFLVNIGGEVYASGTNAYGNKWRVQVEMPYENSSDSLNPIKCTLEVKNLAVSTSGNYRNFYIENGKRYSHEINPHTGYPARSNLLSSTIIARDCESADGYATATMVMGLDASIQFLKKHPELDAILLFSKPDGTIDSYQTKAIDGMIVKQKH